MLSCNEKIFLTTFGLDSQFSGLVRSILRSYELGACSSETLSVASWSGFLVSTDRQNLLNSLLKLKFISFDLEVVNGSSGERIVYTPNLGLATAAIDEFGSINLTEHRIRALMTEANQNMLAFSRLMDHCLLAPWDAAFEAEREKSLIVEEARDRSSVA